MQFYIGRTHHVVKVNKIFLNAFVLKSFRKTEAVSYDEENIFEKHGWVWDLMTAAAVMVHKYSHT